MILDKKWQENSNKAKKLNQTFESALKLSTFYHFLDIIFRIGSCKASFSTQDTASKDNAEMEEFVLCEYSVNCLFSLNFSYCFDFINFFMYVIIIKLVTLMVIHFFYLRRIMWSMEWTLLSFYSHIATQCRSK